MYLMSKKTVNSGNLSPKRVMNSTDSVHFLSLSLDLIQRTSRKIEKYYYCIRSAGYSPIKIKVRVSSQSYRKMENCTLEMKHVALSEHLERELNLLLTPLSIECSSKLVIEA